MLAHAIKRFLPAEFELLEYDLPEFDMTHPADVAALGEQHPQVIINCAAYTNVDGCEENVDLAMQVNGEGPGFLAELALKSHAILVHISTDFVFSGHKQSPYLEEDSTGPISVYGKSKLFGEEKIKQSGLKNYFILRTSWLYGSGGNNFVETMIRLAKQRPELNVVADQVGSPTWTDDLAQTIFSLLQTEATGIYHYSNQGHCSWFEFACEIVNQVAQREELVVNHVNPIPTEDYPLPAARPKYSVLAKQKISQLTQMEIPSWQESLARYIQQRSNVEGI